jgi:hypothetical protein
MLRTTAKNNLKQSLKAILVVAALGLTAGSANAQYGNSAGTSFGARLGGPVIAADYSGYGNYGGGYGGYSGFNNGFYGSAGAYGNYANYSTPQNIAFNGNGQIGVGSNGVTGGNQLITDPLLGFQQPRTIIDPTTGQVISISSAAANASANFNAQLAQFNANRTALVNAAANGTLAINQQIGVTGSTFVNGQVVPGNVLNNGVVRMPSDGSIVVQSTGTANGQVVPGNVLNNGVVRMPSDGSIVVQSTDTATGQVVPPNVLNNGVVRMPSDGSFVVQSNGFSNFANGLTYGSNMNANYNYNGYNANMNTSRVGPMPYYSPFNPVRPNNGNYRWIRSPMGGTATTSAAATMRTR